LFQSLVAIFKRERILKRGRVLKNRIRATTMLTVASIVMVLAGTAAAQSADKIVKIDSGMVEGAVSGEVLSFKGIP
jgi:hypothetical protein